MRNFTADMQRSDHRWTKEPLRRFLVSLIESIARIAAPDMEEAAHR